MLSCGEGYEPLLTLALRVCLGGAEQLDYYASGDFRYGDPMEVRESNG